MLTRVDPSSFQDQDLVIDAGAIFASVVLLLLMLAFTFNRILGLDQILIKAARTATARREKEERDAMQKDKMSAADKRKAAISAGVKAANAKRRRLS
ncbi:hypothetical protein HXX76_002669 [Chlamydomonas incerta]|uniref:Uncharacterized protein n=1 Tax=Chlamydomonas incerta TaxID=51695 RepID=A0A835TBX5_CHLIN|nr:hypothetical protein HXX76_002669 [Chlamydomonas incerta]|eukprot:KAG2442584.1 hypothetical protein HXX76_002669 [Chlamydomonas incerta]